MWCFRQSGLKRCLARILASLSTANVTRRYLSFCNQRGILPPHKPYYSPPMQLVQIGQTPSMTLQQLIDQMADRQSAEIQRLKQAALEQEATARIRRASKGRSGRARCTRNPILASS